LLIRRRGGVARRSAGVAATTGKATFPFAVFGMVNVL